jgi:hypothetical protein
MVLSGCGKSAVRIGVSLHPLEFSKTYVGYINLRKVVNKIQPQKFYIQKSVVVWVIQKSAIWLEKFLNKNP